jgi:hypothetical protein
VLRPSRPWLSRPGSTTDAKHHSPKRGKYASTLVFKPSAGQFGSVWGVPVERETSALGNLADAVATGRYVICTFLFSPRSVGRPMSRTKASFNAIVIE